MRLCLVLAVSLLLACCRAAWPGPPFITDDPEPVEYRHWEVYVSSIVVCDPSGTAGTLPHIEVNNGPAPNLQVHMILPYAFSRAAGEGTNRGLGNVELGVKYRFVQEKRRQPMVGIFPLIQVPTGSESKGLGGSHFQFFLPVWLQKSWGPWTTYGGGGYFINPGQGNRSYWLFGCEIQKDLSEQLTLGGEVFGTTPDAPDAPAEVNFNLGGFYNFDEGHHLLFSAGRGISGDIEFMSYLGFQWTFGPHEPRTSAETTGLSFR